METKVMDNDDSVEVDLLQIFRVIMTRIWVILLSGILTGIIALVITQTLITPMYTSSVKLYVISRQSDQTTTLSDIQSSTQLVKDYKVLVTSLPVVDQVITDLGLNIDNNDLINKIECTIETDSRVLAITVTDADPVQAKHIADDLADVFSSRITQIMKIDSVNVIEYGSVAESPASPNVKKNVAIGLLIGILLSTSIIVIRFIVDDTIKTSEDVERYLGISTLSLIPLTREEYNGKKSKRKRRLRR